MPQKATEDTYAFEQVGPDAFVRREIKAGFEIPPGLYADEEGNQPLDGEEVNRSSGLTSAYLHQQDENGNVTEEHQSKVAPYEPPLKEGEVVTGQEQTPTDQVEKGATTKSSPEDKGEPQSKKPTQQPEVRREK